MNMIKAFSSTADNWISGFLTWPEPDGEKEWIQAIIYQLWETWKY